MKRLQTFTDGSFTGAYYLCDDVDPVTRELRAEVLYERGRRNFGIAGCYGGTPSYKRMVRAGYLLFHYARLIRENKPGWWQ